MTDQPEQLGADEHILLTLKAINDQDDEHAGFHMSEAYYMAPMDEDYHQVFLKWMAVAEDPIEALRPPEGEPFSAQAAALLAEVYVHQGQEDLAVYWLARVIEASKHMVLLERAIRWMADARARARVGTDALTVLFSSIGQAYLGESIDEPDVAEQLELIVPWIEQVVTEREDASLRSFAANVLRKLNAQTRALEMAKQAYALKPSHQSAVVVALCYRSLDDIEMAFETYALALSHDEDDVSVRLDMGDLLCSRGRFEEGLARYQEVLDREPDHMWANAYMPFYQFKQSGHLDDLNVLMTRAYEGNKEAGQLFNDIRREQFGPYLGYLPSPADATINILEQYIEKDVDGFFVTLTASAPEAASVQIVLRHVAQQMGHEPAEYIAPGAQTAPCHIAEPEVKTHLWRFEDGIVSPNLEPASQVWQDLIAQIAQQYYFMPVWLNQSTQMNLPLNEDDVISLLSIMVHPPERPEGYLVWTWMYLCQFAAGAVLFGNVTPETWANSPIRQAAFDVIHGPLDWSIEATIVPVSEVALTLESGHPMRAEVLDWLMKLMLRMPKDLHVCYIYALFETLLKFSEVPDNLRNDLKLALEKMLS